VAIARSLVNDPEIILADEPTGNLDSKTEQEIMEMLLRLNREGRTIIMVTHETSVARLAKRQIYMKDGVIAGEGLFPG
jgi:putative ABC transport system ATP-binding protein